MNSSRPPDTPRLQFRQAVLDDAPFFLQLLTEPSWRRFIREHDVDSVPAARTYLRERILTGYKDGLGFWLVEGKEDQQPLGICGLIKRPYLDHADLGFALLEKYWGQGFAREAAEAVMTFARASLGMSSLLAITLPENTKSIELLARLGFSQERQDQAPDGETIIIYHMDL